MAEVTDVDITNGIPTAGTGTVPTLSKTNTVIGAVNESAPGTDTASSGLNGRLQRIAQRVTSLIAATLATSVADGMNVTFGAKADAKSTATDTTAITAMSVWKQISASVQLVVFGAGTAATAQRVTFASDAPGVANMIAGEYETVAASATAQVIGATGAAGDYLSHVIVSPATAGCGVVTILDNATTIVAFAGGGTTALTSLIPFTISVEAISTSGAWKITTGANVSCTAVGNFT